MSEARQVRDEDRAGCGWVSAGGAGPCQATPTPLLILLLSAPVVTGATSGIGKAYAHEVSRGSELGGRWALPRSGYLLPGAPSRLGIVW